MGRGTHAKVVAEQVGLKSQKVEGFGFDPAESQHHFRVLIPARKDERVFISEHFSAEDTPERMELNLALGAEDSKLRAILPRQKWDEIAEVARIEFNERLRLQGIKPGKWKVGANAVSRLLGKELVLLAWAIEDADPALIQVAIRNWLGFAPEERWWLFTMTNAATGHATAGRNKGWRKAVRFALTENPVSEHRARRAFAGLFEDLGESDYISDDSERETDKRKTRKEN